MTVTCLHVSDVHLRADGRSVDGRDPEARLRVVLDACAREALAVDLVVLGGDQSDDGEAAAMQRVKDLVAGSGARLLAVQGNHDGAHAHQQVFGRGEPVELGAWRVLGLDSSLAGEIHGSLDVPALESLLDGLDARPTMIALHHPPVAPTTHPWFRLEHAEQLLESVRERPHVRALISGHVHTPFELRRGSTLLLGGPSTLIPFRFEGGEVTVGEGGPTGARVIELREDGSITSAVLAA